MAGHFRDRTQTDEFTSVPQGEKRYKASVYAPGEVPRLGGCPRGLKLGVKDSKTLFKEITSFFAVDWKIANQCKMGKAQIADLPKSEDSEGEGRRLPVLLGR